MACVLWPLVTADCLWPRSRLNYNVLLKQYRESIVAFVICSPGMSGSMTVILSIAMATVDMTFVRDQL